jgi:hypothetical protein
VADRIWARIDGVLGKETSRAVMFLVDGRCKWIPKSQLGRIEYEEGGDSREIRVGQAVRSVEVPPWLAREKDIEELEI